MARARQCRGWNDDASGRGGKSSGYQGRRPRSLRLGWMRVLRLQIHPESFAQGAAPAQPAASGRVLLAARRGRRSLEKSQESGNRFSIPGHAIAHRAGFQSGPASRLRFPPCGRSRQRRKPVAAPSAVRLPAHCPTEAGKPWSAARDRLPSPRAMRPCTGRGWRESSRYG